MPGQRVLPAQFAMHVFATRRQSRYDDRERTKFWTAYTGHNAGVTHRCYLALVLCTLATRTRLSGLVSRHMSWLERSATRLAWPCRGLYGLPLHFCRLGAQVEAAAEEEIAIGKGTGFSDVARVSTFKGRGCSCKVGQRRPCPFSSRDFIPSEPPARKWRFPYYLSMLGDAYTQSARFGDGSSLNEGWLLPRKTTTVFRRPSCTASGSAAGRVADKAPQPRTASPSYRDGPAPAEPGMGVRTTMSLARSGYGRAPRRGPRRARGRLRHVHGRVHDAGPRGRRALIETWPDFPRPAAVASESRPCQHHGRLRAHAFGQGQIILREESTPQRGTTVKVPRYL